MVCLGRPYHFHFFKGCLPQILLGPFLNTLSQILVDIPSTRSNALKPSSESHDSDDTLLAVDFNHATQLSSANNNR